MLSCLEEINCSFKIKVRGKFYPRRPIENAFGVHISTIQTIKFFVHRSDWTGKRAGENSRRQLLKVAFIR